jgi:FAD/FMN-containing dehydrogenase
LAAFFTLSAELDPVHEYGVAWVDCLATGEAAGRGIYMVGDHARIGELEIKPSRKRSVPFVLPVSAVNNVTLRAFNSAYYTKQKAGKQQSRTDFEPFFYPLDGILHWNRIYGRRGFQQFQCVIPDHNAEPATRALLAAIARSGTGSFLAVLKRCGNIASPGLMSFPMSGTSLALDFPNNARLDRLLRDLDVIVNEAGGRLYPAKDAHMRGEDFRRAYPQWHEVEALRDPLLCSQFWKRVTQS